MEDHDFSPSDGDTGAFEERVQQKMANMELTPTGEVWEKVQEKLYPENKRRRWVFWLIFLLAGLGLGGYFLLNPLASTKQIQSSVPTKHKITNAGEKSGRATRNETTNSNSPITRDSGSNLTDKVSSPLQLTKTGGTAANIDSSKEINEGNSKEKSAGWITSTSKNSADIAVLPKTPKGKLSQITSQRKASLKTKDEMISANQAGSSETETQKAVPPVIQSEAFPVDESTTRPLVPSTINSLLDAGSTINVSGLIENEDKTPSLLKTKLKKANLWSWGFVLVAGRSASSSAHLNSLFKSTTAADFLSSAPVGNGSGNGNGNSNIPTPPTPSAVKAGPAFKAGLVVNRRLNRQLSVSFGLNYNQFSLSNTVGRRVDSTMSFSGSQGNTQFNVNRYFRTGITQKYINRYHFIELPVLLHAGLRNEKIPVALDFGFSISRLLASNALHYDASSGFYYKDNSLFNRTQVNLVTALPVRIFSGNTFSIDAGPHLQYGLTKILSDQGTNGKHFFFMGLKAGVLFRKK